ncbi:hypothetical protein HOY80DRAFT_1035105 [Tuber brumale]|nr:hypothetical protein HOY80DRAFT_1035105 [Tuber brumale]
MKLEQNFNICGALERIVFQARLEKKIGSKHGTQKGLNELSQKSNFIDILEKIVQERRLVHKDIEDCFPHSYHRVSIHANCNNGTTATRGADFEPNKWAALAVLLRLQGR